MAHYFLVHDGDFFEAQFRPTLSACWKQRSFSPARELCLSLRPRIDEFNARHRITDPPLAVRVPDGLPFHRDFWTALVGELLFHAAVEIPEFQTCPDTLLCLLAPEALGQEPGPPDCLPPIQQAHVGSRDLRFGPAFYRPEHCGFNHRDDVSRLATYLDSVQPDDWRSEALTRLPSMEDGADREEELAIARDWFPLLRDLYRRSADAGRAIVCEFV